MKRKIVRKPVVYQCQSVVVDFAMGYDEVSVIVPVCKQTQMLIRKTRSTTKSPFDRYTLVTFSNYHEEKTVHTETRSLTHKEAKTWEAEYSGKGFVPETLLQCSNEQYKLMRDNVTFPITKAYAREIVARYSRSLEEFLGQVDYALGL